MATVPSTSLLSRTRSGRLPTGKSATALGHDPVIAHATAAATGPGPASQIPIATSHVSVFLTNLRLLDLDLRPDWPNITARTFVVKDATQGQKRRIQSVEWALYHLFCLWDPDEARSKMKPFFPPADQVQSVNLRAAFLRALEQAKKNGALGRDAILRKTMLDECRGERLEEILAVFSSAVLKRVVVTEDQDQNQDNAAVARALALENRGYSAERTQINALILAHKASLGKTLRQKEVARARYRGFAELLALKERGIARRRELARVLQEEDNNERQDSDGSPAKTTTTAVSDDVKLRLQRLVRNNWSGSEQWMNTLVYGDERSRKDSLLSTPPDRVWRRVQAGRLGELEGKSDSGLLDQLDKRVSAQGDRLHQWREYGKHVLGKETGSTTATRRAPDELQSKKKTGIDLGFGAHDGLYPTLSPRKGGAHQQAETPCNDDYMSLLRSFEDELAHVNQPQQGKAPLTALLQARRAGSNRGKAAAHARKASRAAAAGDTESDISDIEEHPIVQQPLSAPPSEDTESPTRRRVLLTKKSMTFSSKSYHSDEEPEPLEFLPTKIKRAATIQVDQPLPPAMRKLSGQKDALAALPLRRRQQSPPIRPPRAARATPPPPQQQEQHRPPPPPVLRTPSPDRSPPPPTPPSDDDGPFELVSTPQHSIILQPPPAKDGPSVAAASPSQELADQILASMDNASPSPMKRPRHTLSLAERTRMSMARASRGARILPGHGDSDEDDGDGDDNEENESQHRDPNTLPIRRNANSASITSRSKSTINKEAKGMEDDRETQGRTEANGGGDGGYEDLVARTRKSMAGFEAARQKAQLDRRRSQRKSRQSSLGVGAAAASSTATSRREAAAAAAAGNGAYFPAVQEGDGDSDDVGDDEDTTMLAEELMSGGQDDAEAIFRSRPKIKMSPIPSPTRELEED